MMISEIRQSLREIVRCLGFTNYQQRYYGLSVSQVHSIIELDLRKSMTSQEMASVLLHDKSTVSRMLDGLEQAGITTCQPNPNDGRSKLIKLTPKGVELAAQINGIATSQTERAIGLLNNEEKQIVQRGVRLIAKALAKDIAKSNLTPSNLKEKI